MIPLSRIRERKLVQWALAYLAGAWLVLQVLDLLVDNFGWQTATFRAVAALLAVGFLAALVLAWYHGERGAQRVSGIEIGLLAGILVLAAVGVTLVGRLSASDGDARTADAAAVEAAVVPAVAEQGSIAVLPFVDMSPNKDQEYFSDGLTEELLNVLARIPELRVAARTSSFAFKNKEVPVDSIGRALRVQHVLEGSVRTAGQRVRITAQLVNAANGFHLWSETYDRELKDVFAVQDEISRAIVDALQVRLSEERANAALATQETSDPEAHRLVLRAWNLVTPSRAREDVAAASEMLKQAIARDPSYARAHAALAWMYQWQAYRRWAEPAETYELARESAQRAIALDPRNAEAHVLLGRVADVHDWRFEEAERHFRNAVEINPSYAEAHNFRAWLLMRLGRRDAALASARRAIELDRLSASALNTLGAMYIYAGDPAQAVPQYQAALELVSPGARGVILSNLALTYSELRRHDDALRTLEQTLRAAPEDQFALATAGIVHARAGNRAEAEAAIRRLQSQRHGSAYILAGPVYLLGDADRALDLLEKAVADREDFVPDLGVDPTFAGLHGHPRFRALLKKMGLPAR